MKPCHLILGICLVLSFAFQSAPAQTDWQWQYPQPQGNSLYAVDHYGGVAIAVGAAGTVMISTSGVSGWSVITNAAGLRETLRGVCVIGPSSATAVGDNGAIIRTDDAGNSWAVQNSGTSETLYDVTFTSITTGYTVGGSGTLLKTADSGANWVPLTSPTTEVLNGVSFADPDTGTVVGSRGTILRTTDAGATWIVQTCGTTAALNAVQLITTNTGYAIAGSSLLKTTDGGDTWNTAGSWGVNLADLSFADAYNGCLIGNYGGEGPTVFIYMWSIPGPEPGDVETYWEVDEQPGPMCGVAALGAWDAVAVGLWGMMRATSDGGLSWPVVGGPPADYYPLYMGGLDFWDIYTAVAVTHSGTGVAYTSRVLRTTDGGATWSRTTVWSGPGIHLYDIAFADENTVYAVGRGLPAYDFGGVILRSLDGGASWEEYVAYLCWPGNPNCVWAFYDIDFGDPDHGIVIGSDGAILKLGGSSSVQAETVNSLPLSAVSMPNATTVFGVGGGTIYRSTDGGSNWVAQKTVSVSLGGVHFTDADHGTVVGANGTILRTWNGGENWYPKSSGTTDDLYKVSFSSTWVGFVLSRSGAILKTIDGGATWISEPGPIGTMTDLHTINRYNVTIVGDNWSILARRDEATVPVDFATLTATALGDAIRLEWSTGGDGLIRGYHVYRRKTASDDYTRLNHQLIPGQTYTFTDPTARPGFEYEYVTGVVFEDGSEIRSNVAMAVLPATEIELFQNYPNPFNPGTSISYTVDRDAHVTLGVYDVGGRLVRTLVNRTESTGTRTAEWDGRDENGQPLSSGVYFCRLKAGKRTLSRKLILLK